MKRSRKVKRHKQAKRIYYSLILFNIFILFIIKEKKKWT